MAENSLVVSLELLTAKFDAGVAKANGSLQGIQHEAHALSSAFRGLSVGLSALSFSGLAEESKGAHAALMGLAGTLSLISVVGAPIAITIGAIATAFALSSGAAKEYEDQLKKVDEEHDKLLNPKESRMDKLHDDFDKLASQAAITQQKMSEIETEAAKYGQSIANLSGPHAELAANLAHLNDEMADTQKAMAEEAKVVGEKATQSLKQMAIATIETSIRHKEGAEAALRFDMAFGKLRDTVKDATPYAKLWIDQLIKSAKGEDDDAAATERDNKAKKEKAEALKRMIAFQDYMIQQQKDVDAAQAAGAHQLLSLANPAWQAYQDKLAEINADLALNPQLENAATEARANALKQYQDSMQKIGDNKFADQAARNIETLTADFFKGSLSAQNFAQSVVKALRDIAAELLSQSILQSIFGSFRGSGGILGTFADGLFTHHASGGDMSGGEPGIVGESGPELFVPKSAGTIIPNGKFGGQSVQITQHIDARGSDVQTVVAAAQAGARAAVSAVLDVQRGRPIRI